MPVMLVMSMVLVVVSLVRVVRVLSVVTVTCRSGGRRTGGEQTECEDAGCCGRQGAAARDGCA
jgi:hypothetical protein